MKKNEKILQNARDFTEDWLGKLVVITAMIITVLAECVGLIMAIAFKNYLLQGIIFKQQIQFLNNQYSGVNRY